MERKAHNSLNEAALEVQRQTHEGEESLQEKGLQSTLRQAKAGKLSRKDARKAMETHLARAQRPRGGRDDTPYTHKDILHNAEKIKKAWIDSQKNPLARRKAEKRISKPMDARQDQTPLKLHSTSSSSGWRGVIPASFAGSSPRSRSGEAGKLAPKYDHVEYDEVDSMVLEYFSNYFGDELNEDTFDGDIIDAVKDLILLTEAVCEAVGLDEISVETAARAATARQNREVVRDEPRKRGDKQVAKNIMHVYKKAEKMGIDPEHPDIEKEMKKGAEGEQKKMTKTQKERLLSKARHDALEKRVFKHLESE